MLVRYLRIVPPRIVRLKSHMADQLGGRAR
jgi:hypothetical protein